MAYVLKLGGLWKSFVTFVVINILISFGIFSSATSEQLLDIEIGELGYGRVTNGSLGEYNFPRVNCLKRVFPNFLNQTTVLPSLQATIRSDCPSDDEINSQSSVYLSRTDVSQFVTAISSSKSQGSFTVEMLFKPNVTGNPQYSEIFSLTRLSTDETCFSLSQGTNTSSFGGIDMQVLIISSTKRKTRFNIVQQNGRGMLLFDRMNHIVVVFSVFTFNKQSVISANCTVNGVFASHVTATTTRGIFDYSTWLEKPPALVLFKEPYTSVSENSFESAPNTAGLLSFLGFYRGKLSYSHILQNYHSFPKSVYIQEDGEVGDHTLDPAFYSSIIPNNQLAVIKMTDVTGGPKTVLQIRTASLPSTAIGTFYYLNGTKMTPSSSSSSSLTSSAYTSVPFNVAMQSYAIRFRPAKNKYGKSMHYAFSYTMYNTITGVRSLGYVIKIYVSRVNKPPVPTVGLLAYVLQGQKTILTLKGTDLDSKLAGSVIVTLPSKGILYKSNGMTPLLLSNSSSKSMSLSKQLYRTGYYRNSTYEIVYRTNTTFDTASQFSLSKNDTAMGVISRDSFYFALQDVEGRRSILGLYQIAVVPSIIAKPNALMQNWFPVVKENTLSRIVLSAGDLLISSTAIPPSSSFSSSSSSSSSSSPSSSSSISSSARQIIIQITKLPLNGVLYTSNTSSKSLIEVNDIIYVMKKNQSSPKFEIFYLGNQNFFTFPNRTYNNSVLKSLVPMGDYFQFRAITGGFYSTIVTQRITVRNVNNPTNIDISQLASNPKGFAVSPVIGEDDSILTISGIKVLDPDLNVDPVRCLVFSELNSLISLNVDKLTPLTFNCNGCKGNGIGAAIMIFDGMPSDVQAALNGLSVRSLVPNIVDTINITIYNGENGNCIPSKLLPNTSYRPKCHITSVIFQITVNGFISPEDLRGNVEIASKSGILSLAFRQILIGSLVSGVFVIGVLRCLYLRRLKKRIDKRKKEIEMNKKSPKVIEKSIRAIDDKTDFPDQKNSKHRKELGMKHFERYSHNDDDMRHEEKSYKIVDLDSVMDGTRARYGQPSRSIGVHSPPPPPLHITNPSYENPRDYPSTPQYKKESPMGPGTGTGTGTGTPSTQKSVSVTTNSPPFSTPPMSSTRSYPTTPQGISSPQRGLTSLNERMDLGPNIPRTPSRTISNNYSEFHRNEGVTSSPTGPKSPSYPSTPQKNNTSYVPEHSRNMPSSSILGLSEESPQRLNDDRNICLERSRGASNYTRKQEHSPEHSEMMSPHNNGPPIKNNSEEHSSPKSSRAFTRNSPGTRQSSRFDYSVMKDINSTLQIRRQEENLDGRTTTNHDNEYYQKEKNKNEHTILPVTSLTRTICDDNDEKINKDFESRVAAAAERNQRSPTQSQPSVSHSHIQLIDTSPPIRRLSDTAPTHPTSFHNDSSRSLLRAAHSANKHLRNLTTQGPGPDRGPFPTTQHIPPVPDSLLPLPLPQGREDQAESGVQSAESSPPRGSVYRQSNKKTSDVN